MTAHTLRYVDRLGGKAESWRTHCRCGWRSPVVADRRTAEQAHAAHARTVQP